MSTGDAEAVMASKSLNKLPELAIYELKFIAISIQIQGYPYASYKSFWFKLLPLVIVLGVVVGLFSLSYFRRFLQYLQLNL